ncbi:MAG: hypothetical protein WC898_00605 [Candidatus Paceibacterota bacterium]|jgi:hypothetical protein
MKAEHIIVFSHGFGTRKDDRGLFSIIANEFAQTPFFLFDYNRVDEERNILTVRPLSEQAKMLNDVISKSCLDNPNAMVDIIAHSQGCLVVALAKPLGIRKIVFITPSLDSDIEHTINMFKERRGTEINLLGVSKLARKDGSTTMVPAEFWEERKKINPIPLYNELCLHTDLLIINAKQDDVMGKVDARGLDERIKVISLDGDHQFYGEARAPLIEEIKLFLV